MVQGRQSSDPIERLIRRFVGLAPHLEDDLRSEAALARLEADALGTDGIRLATNRMSKLVRYERQARPLVDDVDQDVRVESLPPIKRKLSAGQRKRFRRDLVIQAAHVAGCSQRLIAEVFNLPRSRIYQIVRTDMTRRFQVDGGRGVRMVRNCPRCGEPGKGVCAIDLRRGFVTRVVCETCGSIRVDPVTTKEIPEGQEGRNAKA